ncbi:AT-hook motif nuclear-localized protein 9-like [Andrographis paniculata]|uniref:AT-hook motif nuclear-localized protein 9-like n=1 Tax=Andrographis paniculata TaxID=175694 RepID=UPI0021E8A9F4|nr:AT-hook motif nuclear-localized protein 9-like [Andrographis paniculata]XP_051129471.1 AT-hook motif nuclear-localized protein 9-like [Andrographis paniculata]
MDGREGMALQGSAAYYLNRGGGIGGSGGSGGGSAAGQPGGVHTPPGFKNFANPGIPVHHSNVGMSGGSVGGSPFHVENPSPGFPHGLNMSGGAGISAASQGQGGEIVKKKRGRPRKYGPDGANMSLGLSPSPMPASTPSSSGNVGTGEKRRGRPPGTGWKQKLAPLGEWMNSSAGLAFTPHVLLVESGEDVAAKILAFAQQRPRALCILSGNGSVSALTLRQPTSSGSNITYEGRFEILCLSGSYLLAEDGGPHNRTGGISISVCSPDGHMLGGAIGGRLIAANPVQVVACSFVYNGPKAKSNAESETADRNYLLEHSGDKGSNPIGAPGPGRSLASGSGTSVWPLGSRLDGKNPQADIDLMRG